MGTDYSGSLQQIQKSTVSSQGIMSFDWCPDKIGLAVCCSFDAEIRLLYISKLQLQWYSPWRHRAVLQFTFLNKLFLNE